MIRFQKYAAGILFLAVFTGIVIFSQIQNQSNIKESNFLQSGKNIHISYESATMTMDMEDFIPLVLMAEMDDQSPRELIKAQSVVIRTYILYCMKGENEISADKLGLPYKTPKQLKERWFSEEKLYRTHQISGIAARLFELGKGRVYSERMKKLKQVIAETDGKVLKIEGKLILPLFHEISNGKTRSGKELLGEEYSYLKSTQCDLDMESVDYEDTKEMTVPEILKELKENRIVVFEDGKESDQTDLSAKDFFAMIDDSHQDSSGYIQYILLGDVKIDGNDFAEILGLKSCAMDMEAKEDKILFHTRGIGHGFGMSLNSADRMAERGDSYEKILKNFYDAALVKNVNGEMSLKEK